MTAIAAAREALSSGCQIACDVPAVTATLVGTSIHRSRSKSPELSLTGYEPKLAKNLATTQNDAKKYSMTVLMSNCLGLCDDFESVGKSAIWNQDGLLVRQLNETAEGILLYDTDAEKIIE